MGVLQLGRISSVEGVMQAHPAAISYRSVRLLATGLVIATVSAIAIGQSFEVVQPFPYGPSNHYAPLLQAPNGKFYGTTTTAGLYNYGTLFEYDPATSLIVVIHDFAYYWTGDGAKPFAGLVVGPDGKLYGTAQLGGASACGTIFVVDPETTEYSTIHSFNCADPTDGAYPFSRLFVDGDGQLYGTTASGGEYGSGTVYRLDPSTGVVVLVHSFQDSNSSDGASLLAGVIRANDGFLYGTAAGGGAYGDGVIFTVDPSGGGFTVLHDFNRAIPSEGGSPFGGISQASDGSLYGTTVNGGTDDAGTVYRLNPSNELFEIVQSFPIGGAGNRGGPNRVDLLEACGDRLVGTTEAGGTGDGGTVFSTNLNTGELSILHTFELGGDSIPLTGLIQADDGWLYGLTSVGGNSGYGSIFKVLVSCNTPPVIASLAPTPVSISENGVVTLPGAFMDPDSGDTHAVSINWGDGSANSTLSLAAGAFTFSASHQYLDDAPTGTPSDVYGITVTVTDNAGAFGAGGTTVTVSNVAPVVASLTSPTAPIAIGGTAAVSATFTDVGSLDTHICVFVWDDGSSNTTVTPPGTGNGSCSASHTYAAAGVYDATVNITDDETGSVTGDFGYIVVYDPNGGFVTGGGWFNSLAGAYPANPPLTGKANFGFVAKYQNNLPVGETEFQFADLNLHSTSYDWLVISGAQGQYQGSGTINGAGNFGFLVTVIDGQASGGGGTDKIRVKIWDKNNGNAVVYDNQPGAPNGASPTTPIGGGSIVLHN